MLRGIKAGFNTVFGNENGGIIAPVSKVSESVLVGNVGASVSGEPVFPSRQAGLAAEDNLICNKSCFVDVENNDFSAAKDSSLERRRVGYTAGWLPGDDFSISAEKIRLSQAP